MNQVGVQNDTMIDLRHSEDELPSAYAVNMGRFIRARRKDLGKNQTVLGVEVGLDSGAISRLENGKQLPRLAIIFRLSKALKVSMCDMMAAAESVSDIDDLRKFLLYKSAPPVYRTLVDTALQATERENANRNPLPAD